MAKVFRFTETFDIDDLAIEALQIAEAKSSKNGFIPKIEAIHVGATKNYTRYWAEKLKGDPDKQSGCYSWTEPYPKPVIKNHNVDEEPLGRITKVEFGKGARGRECIIVYPKITDPEAIQKVQDGRYKTVSVGAETGSAVCSICGTNIVEEGMCEHRRGQKYNQDGKPDPLGETCYWDIGDIWFEELSFVNVPADPDAGTVGIGESYDIFEEGGTSEIMLSKEQLLELKNKLTDVPSANLDDPQHTEENLDTDANPTHVDEGVVNPVVDDPTVDDKANELAEALEKVETLTTQLDEANTKLTLATEELTTVKSQLVEAVATSLALTEQVEDLQSRIISTDQENQTLLDENAELQSVMHRSLAERVVDLKISLGKPSMAKRDEAIQEHIERSTESLQDQLEDLLTEAAEVHVVHPIDMVPNPALVLDDDKKLKTPAVEPIKESVSTEDVLRKLFGGSLKSKKEAN